MARKRMIDPEFFLDENVSVLSPHARLLYIGLWGICDDNFATLPDRPDWIKAQVFPYEVVDTRRLLDELSNAGKIVGFEKDGKKWWYLKNFFKHQRIDRPSKPKYPEFVGILDEHSTSTRTETKISKDKIREENTGAARTGREKFSTLGAELIKEFEKVDPKNKRYYANKTQRKAADFLIEEYGFEETMKRVRILTQTNKMPYFPKIYTPFDLQEKWGKLQDAVEQERGKKKAGNNFIL